MTMSPASSTRTVAFFGASGGCGLAALRRSVATGYTCIAQCRQSSKLTAHFPSAPHNLIIREGNAHDEAAVRECLLAPGSPAGQQQRRLVDAVCLSIGSTVSGPTFSMADPDVCMKGVATLLAALRTLRTGGAEGRPLLAMVSTTGISPHGRDVPWLLLPMYKLALHAPHADKRVAEERLRASEERWVVVRPSLLVEGEAGGRPVREQVESAEGIESHAIGYTISRDEVGAWIYEKLLRRGGGEEYVGKAVGVTW